MKEGIHPTYFPDTRIVCVCGNRDVVGSTKEEIHIEVCSNCHPLFTGEEKYIDTEGRVEKFVKKQKIQEERKKELEAKAEKKAQSTKASRDKEERPKSLKEMLESFQ